MNYNELFDALSGETEQKRIKEVRIKFKKDLIELFGEFGVKVSFGNRYGIAEFARFEHEGFDWNVELGDIIFMTENTVAFNLSDIFSVFFRKYAQYKQQSV